MSKASLTQIRVQGFRSLRDVALDLTPVTVLIGPNGAGKSNLLWALEMTRLLAFESLQLFVGERGGATYLMHYGPQQTPAIDLDLTFSTENGENAYSVRLGYGANESLVFLWEKAGYRRSGARDWQWTELGAGHLESRLGDEAEHDTTARTVLWFLRRSTSTIFTTLRGAPHCGPGTLPIRAETICARTAATWPPSSKACAPRQESPIGLPGAGSRARSGESPLSFPRWRRFGIAGAWLWNGSTIEEPLLARLISRMEPCAPSR